MAELDIGPSVRMPLPLNELRFMLFDLKKIVGILLPELFELLFMLQSVASE